jgi:hypothetical protein
MEILRNLRRLESRLTRSVEEATQKVAPVGPPEPLEILHAIVEAIEKRIEPAGRGKYVFPFNLISIRIAAESRDTQSRFEAVLESEPTLQDRIVDRLQASGCDSTGVTIVTTFVERRDSDFHIEFDRVANLTDHRLKLTVVRGTTETDTYTFTASRTNIGRCAEVRDSRNRMIRTNQVVFIGDAGDPNPTVSRNHAHIDLTSKPTEFRLYDDRSAHGTSILRNGHTIPVPPGPRGVRLQAEDEIVLGEASLRVEIEVVGGFAG